MIIAQISDTHIRVADESQKDDAGHDLQRAVEHLLRLPSAPDVVIVSGDCVQLAEPAEYQRFKELLRPLTMPVYVIPGNHDDRGQILAMFGTQGATSLEGYVQYVVDGWPVRLIALDSTLHRRDEGQLGADRLQWLEARLAEAPTQPTLIFMHHPPFPMGLRIMDEIGLTDADAFGAVIARHPQVERIVAGHVHTTMMRRFNGTIAMSCGSTRHQLQPVFQRPERLDVVMEPPVCLLHVWTEQTGMVTYTSLIGDHGPVVTMHDGERWMP